MLYLRSVADLKVLAGGLDGAPVTWCIYRRVGGIRRIFFYCEGKWGNDSAPGLGCLA